MCRKDCCTDQPGKWKRPGAGALTLTRVEKGERLLSPVRQIQVLVLVGNNGRPRELCFQLGFVHGAEASALGRLLHGALWARIPMQILSGRVSV